jgi:DNA polymerase-2
MSLTAQTFEGFLLTRNWRDTPQGIELEYWFSTPEGPLCALVRGERSVFFLPEADLPAARPALAAHRPDQVRSVQLRDFALQPVAGLYFSHYRQARRAADALREAGLDPLEADINPADRYLMERFINGSAQLHGTPRRVRHHVLLENPGIRAGDYRPALKVVSYDIETAMQGLQLYSIGVHGWGGEAEVRRVFMLGAGAEQDFVVHCASQEAVLQAFQDFLVEFDPDVLIGWNVVNFDTRYLQRLADQLGLRLLLGRERRPGYWRELDDDAQRFTVQFPGRVVLDGIELLRAAFYRFESFSLENVARELLGEGKLLHGDDRGVEITRLFHEDKTRLADYNLRDCELVSEVFEHTSMLDFAVARTAMTGLNIDRMGGSVASFDNLYLPRLHRRGYVAPNASVEHVASPGGFVLDSQPGIYDHVLVLDFKSLYPSIIRTFCIDPLGLALGVSGELGESDTVPGYLNARFAREGHLLPALIEQLWAQRDLAKENGDEPLSQAIKIIMNSFYGVLGTTGCRFFDARLASSITRRGHQILGRTRDRIEESGHRVIYGDTDSVFVWIHEADSDAAAVAAGRELERALNAWWGDTIREEFRLETALELEFETHYKRFLMPTVRGSDKGSKKRYAGIVAGSEGDRLVFKGLENVRTDWTRLAREFQEELYRRVFMDEPYEEYVCGLTARVLAGEENDRLVYRKRLRRRLDDYQRNVPPHVQAARLCAERGLPVPSRGDWVEYVITTGGAEPAAQPLAPLDHQHYVDRQLAPVADGILGLLGNSFSALTDRQIGLFQG